MKRKILRNIIVFFIICIILLYVLLNNNSIISKMVMPEKKQTVASMSIGVSLLENGKIVAESDEAHTIGTILEAILAEGENFKVGKNYELAISTQNSGSIDHYVRVIISKYWADETNKADKTLNPEFIELGKSTDGWLWDESYETSGRCVAYYKYPVGEGGEVTPPVINSIRVNDSVQYEYEEIRDGNNIILQNRYNNKEIIIEVDAEVVQTYAAEDAMKSGWGVDATISDNGEIIAIN